MDKSLQDYSVEVKDFKTSVDCYTKYNIKKLTRKNKNKGLLQLPTFQILPLKLQKSVVKMTDSMERSRQVPPQHHSGRDYRVKCKIQTALKPSLKPN